MSFLGALTFFAVSWQQLLTGSQERLGLRPDPSLRDRLALHPADAPWSQIIPSQTIHYHDCFHGLQCARLLLPLDGSDGGSNSALVAIALMRRPAKVNVIDPRYGGALILNPGGPAGSGIEALLNEGERLQKMVDTESEPTPDSCHETPAGQYFDIISFDPRGVNHSVPKLNCFPDTFNRLVWSLGADAEGLIGTSSTAFDQKWSRYLSRSITCMKLVEEEGNESIAYYMGTRSVVDDIVAIAEHHGKWREAEARKLLDNEYTMLHGTDRQQILENTRWRCGKEPILFWGTSYGTILGSTLAALYPDRLYRMVLDSVLSSNVFFNGSSKNGLNHADQVLAQFVHLCHKYGPETCNFYRDSEEAISQDMGSLLSQLQDTPLAVPATSMRGPDSITLSDMRKFIGKALYRPHQLFPMLAEFLQQVTEGDGSSFADYKATLKSVSVADAQANLYTLSPECKKNGPYSPACTRPHEWLEESMLGVSCGDGASFGSMTKDQFRSYWHDIRNQSRALGDVWTEWDLMCVGWNVQTKRKYEGPLVGDPANPILFVGNTWDPVCPIENAYKLALNFSKSYVLEQKTIGHGIFSAQSTCTEQTIRMYFQNGKLHPKTDCGVDKEPFEEEYLSL